MLVLACGGTAMNSVDELDENCLGSAGLVYEHVLGENKFTFVEQCANPLSVTILMKGPNKHTLTQVRDAVSPGRVFDMINRKVLNTKNIKMFVLDEADEMLSRGFKDQ